MEGVITIVLVICLASIASASYDYKPTRIQTCKSSADCGKGNCCRDKDGNFLGVRVENRFDFGLINRSGFCGKIKSQRHEICDSTCGCEPGYTCYRRMSGVCCIPARCYESKWVKERIEYWKNCHKNPNCHLPPVARLQTQASLNPAL